MQLQARLVHAESGSRIVEVSAHRDGALLASALGEAPTAEEAEDRALARLQRRLGPQPGATTAPDSAEVRTTPNPEVRVRRVDPPETLSPASPPPADDTAPPPAPPQAPPPDEPPPDPEDWSSELAQIDLELRRLGWQRQQESDYLERAFRHPSRSRLTTYADLQAYLQALTGLPAGSDPSTAPVPLRRRDLLSQCDQLLEQLGWDAQRGRHHLEEHFGQSSRQQLSDTQLLRFNMLLEEALMARSS